MKNNHLKILLASPRGFCAGVDRAIEIAKKSIEKYGAPVYVRHEIVHNKHVVDGHLPHVCYEQFRVLHIQGHHIFLYFSSQFQLLYQHQHKNLWEMLKEF